MPIYIRKGPLEIPPGSEKDWASEEHEDYFLRDPDQARDSLPQPYRMIAKVVERLIDQTIELINIREQSREEEKLKKKTDILQPAAEIHVIILLCIFIMNFNMNPLCHTAFKPGEGNKKLPLDGHTLQDFSHSTPWPEC